MRRHGAKDVAAKTDLMKFRVTSVTLKTRLTMAGEPKRRFNAREKEPTFGGYYVKSLGIK